MSVLTSDRRPIVLWWVKRDCRLYDNEALTVAVNSGAYVLPVYIWEPTVYDGPDWGELHTYAVRAALTALTGNLRHHGSDLLIVDGEAVPTLAWLHEKLSVTTIYSHQETGLNHTYARDQAVAAWCLKAGVRWHEVPHNGVARPLVDRDTWQTQFTAAMSIPRHPVPRPLTLPPALRSWVRQQRAAVFPVTRTTDPLPVVGERAGHELLEEFLTTRAVGYAGGVSSMNTAPMACSRLSVHLAWGTVSLRTAVQRTTARLQALPKDGSAKQWRRSLRSFQSRLFWHGHFVQKLEDEVTLEWYPANRAFMEALPVVTGAVAESRVRAWEVGETGFPMIDAAMRYYHHTGWLNFRSRAMLTSFAVHALRLPWQTVLYSLAKKMIDYVPGIHVTQTQMQTGVTGTNTIRVYSPMKQMADHDPHGHFIRRNVAELATCSADEIAAFQEQTLGDYRRPVIDFAAETKQMKDALYRIKKSAAGRTEAARVYHKHGSRKRHGGSAGEKR